MRICALGPWPMCPARRSISGGDCEADSRRMATNDRGDLFHRQQRAALCLKLWHLVSPSKA
jgi:hypothetical protein